VVAGQGTVGLEIMEQLPEVEAILVPIGGGGLVAGTAVAAKAVHPQVQVIGVQAEASPSAYLSLKEGHCYEKYDAAPTIAEGLAGGFGIVPFTIARGLIDEVILVSEEEIYEAVFFLLQAAQLVVEGSGAVGVAALLSGNGSTGGRGFRGRGCGRFALWQGGFERQEGGRDLVRWQYGHRSNEPDYGQSANLPKSLETPWMDWKLVKKRPGTSDRGLSLKLLGR